MRDPRSGDLYYHYKHDAEIGVNHLAYEIVGVGIHTETDEAMVCFRPLFKSDWLTSRQADFAMRPMSEFKAMVQWKGQEKRRFELITNRTVMAFLQESDS